MTRPGGLGAVTARRRHGATRSRHDEAKGGAVVERRDRMWSRRTLPRRVIARSLIVMAAKREGPLNLRHSSFVALTALRSAVNAMMPTYSPGGHA